MAISMKHRRIAYERDGEACIACGTTSGLTIHHRKNRQAGGSKLRDHLANYLTACTVCNGQFENYQLERARLLGWKLQQWEDPYRTAVRVGGEWRLLDDNGTYTIVEQRDVREALEGLDF